MSVVGELYGSVLIKRVRAGNEYAVVGRNVGLGRLGGAWNNCLL